MIGPLDNRISCVALGPADGPIAIMLHGFPDRAESWVPAMRVLARLGFRAVAPDMRGFGDSDMPTLGGCGRLPSALDACLYSAAAASDDVLAVLDYLEDARHGHSPGSERAGGLKPLLLGHDLGGQCAWYLAATRPERFSSAVIAASPHPGLMKANLGPSQLLRSYYMAMFNVPWLPDLSAARQRCKAIAAVFADTRPAPELPPPLAAAISPECPRSRAQCSDWWKLSGDAVHGALFSAKGCGADPVAETRTHKDARSTGAKIVTAVSAAALLRLRKGFERPGRLTAAFAWYRAIFWPPAQTHARCLTLDNTLDLPIVSLAAEYDVALGMELVAQSGRVLRHGCATIVNGASHWVHMERPASLAAAALRVLSWAGHEARLPSPARAVLKCGDLGKQLTCTTFVESAVAEARPPAASVDDAGRPRFRHIGGRVYAPVVVPRHESAADVGAVACAVAAALVKLPPPLSTAS